MALYASFFAAMMTAGALIAQAQNPSDEASKWVGPVVTSALNIVATLFAYLTSRDRLRYDATQAILNNRIQILETEQKQKRDELALLPVLHKQELDNLKACHKTELDEVKKEARKARIKVGKLASNLQCTMLGKPMRFPEELGLSVDDDPPPNQVIGGS